MRRQRLEQMVRGWFVGNFEPASYKTESAEVAVKRYNAGDYEARHHHKIAVEITLVLEGHAELNGISLAGGDIAVLEAGEATDFLAVTDVITVVVKVPSALHDKYLGDP